MTHPTTARCSTDCGPAPGATHSDSGTRHRRRVRPWRASRRGPRRFASAWPRRSRPLRRSDRGRAAHPRSSERRALRAGPWHRTARRSRGHRPSSRARDRLAAPRRAHAPARAPRPRCTSVRALSGDRDTHARAREQRCGAFGAPMRVQPRCRNELRSRSLFNLSLRERRAQGLCRGRGPWARSDRSSRQSRSSLVQSQSALKTVGGSVSIGTRCARSSVAAFCAFSRASSARRAGSSMFRSSSVTEATTIAC